MGMRDIYPGSFTNVIENVFLIKSSYVGSFWFIQTYVLLNLTSILFFKSIDAFDRKYILFFSFFLYCFAFVIERKILTLSLPTCVGLIVNAVMLYLRSQFSFVLEILFSKYSFIRKYISLLIICITAIVRGILLQSMFFAPFSAIIFIIILGSYQYNPTMKKILLYFGKHSTNIWLTHMQYYMIFTPAIVFGSRNVFIIFLTLVLLSIVSSYMIDCSLSIIRRLKITLMKKKSS